MGRKKKLSPEQKETKRLAKLEIKNKISDIKNKISDLCDKHYIIEIFEYDYNDISEEALNDMTSLVDKLGGYYIFDPCADLTKMFITKHKQLSLNIINEYEELNDELLELE